jgi:hypothetical protein
VFLRSDDQVVDFSCGENYFVPELKKRCLRCGWGATGARPAAPPVSLYGFCRPLAGACRVCALQLPLGTHASPPALIVSA